MLKSMNKALVYIESHLNDEIDYTELEKITGTSLGSGVSKKGKVCHT